MGKARQPPRTPRHPRLTGPSPWVRRFAALVPKGGTVLDVACGGGRHARHFLDLGYAVVAVDRDVGPVAGLAAEPKAEVVRADLEGGDPWPFAGVASWSVASP